MNTIVTDTGFAPDTWNGGYTSLATPVSGAALDLPSDSDLQTVMHSHPDYEMIRIDFPNSADGRGFSLARSLRRNGYTGRLRARGHVLADQYAMARRAGFDEVEIAPTLAARQPENQWLFRANWREHDYQSRLRG